MRNHTQRRGENSAALFFPLLLPHVKIFSLLQNAAASGKLFGFAMLLVLEILFFADGILHIAVSFSRALITLGWLKKPQTQKILDRVVWVICAVAFLAAAVAVVRGQLVMFLH